MTADTDKSRRRDDHFAEEDCVDFVRRQAAPERKTRLARHLDSGCARCARAVRLWSAVLSLAADEPSYEPPATTLREVKGRFALQRPPRFVERVARAATLVFDSFRQPLPAFVRAAGPSGRRMLFRAGPYVVRLRLEPQAGSDRLSIVGQIEDEQDPDLSLHDVAVLARKGSKRTLDWTLTNNLGEFLLEPEDAENLQLSVALPKVGTFIVRPSHGTEKPRRGPGARALGAPGRNTGSRRPR